LFKKYKESEVSLYSRYGNEILLKALVKWLMFLRNEIIKVKGYWKFLELERIYDFITPNQGVTLSHFLIIWLVATFLGVRIINFYPLIRTDISFFLGTLHFMPAGPDR